MSIAKLVWIIMLVTISGFFSATFASEHDNSEHCLDGPAPVYSNVKLDVSATPDITNLEYTELVTVKAVLTQPVKWVRTGHRKGCFMLVENPPGVVILHGSAGMGPRNVFYGQGLKHRYATLSVEMFEGSATGSGRPLLPILNYSYAFGALKYLVEAEGFIGENGMVVSEDEAEAGSVRKVAADPDAIGCLGFSWGAVICNQLATELYSKQFGDALYETTYRFASHVANYPVCWARNGTLPGLLFGEDNGAPLTGAPLLIQVGDLDAYDNAEGQSGSEMCKMLKDNLSSDDEKKLVDVVVFEGGHHAFDRLFAVSGIVRDPFARLGIAAGDPDPNNWPEVAIIPDQVIANKSLRNVRHFFRSSLQHH